MKKLYFGWLSVAAMIVACLSLPTTALADGYRQSHELTTAMVVLADVDHHAAVAADAPDVSQGAGLDSAGRLPGIHTGMLRQSSGMVPLLAAVGGDARPPTCSAVAQAAAVAINPG